MLLDVGSTDFKAIQALNGVNFRLVLLVHRRPGHVDEARAGEASRPEDVRAVLEREAVSLVGGQAAEACSDLATGEGFIRSGVLIDENGDDELKYNVRLIHDSTHDNPLENVLLKLGFEHGNRISLARSETKRDAHGVGPSDIPADVYHATGAGEERVNTTPPRGRFGWRISPRA